MKLKVRTINTVKERNKNYFKVGQPVVFELNSYVITVVLNGAT